MPDSRNFEVIIIGGSYSGLSAAMSLGRALRKVVVIDSGNPCNMQTPHAHNFITQDGKTPKEISTYAKEQVSKYNTIKFYNGLAINGKKTDKGFRVETHSGDNFTARKLIFATGLKDIMPDIKGFAECWGISVIHCPYCHGYEVKNEKTGILGNGDYGFQFSKMIANWTRDLTLFTDGKSTLTKEQTGKLLKHNIKIIETEIEGIEHNKGKIKNLVFSNNSKVAIQALYAKPPFIQHCDIPATLGCKLTEQGLIQVDMFQKTTVPGIFASGDNCNWGRAVAVSVAAGNIAGAITNKELIDEEF